MAADELDVPRDHSRTTGGVAGRRVSAGRGVFAEAASYDRRREAFAGWRARSSRRRQPKNYAAAPAWRRAGDATIWDLPASPRRRTPRYLTTARTWAPFIRTKPGEGWPFRLTVALPGKRRR